MRLIPFITLLAGGLLRAEDPWIGTWQVIWASASHDSSQLTIAKDAEGLRLLERGQPPRVMRRVDDATAEYSFERDGRTTTVRCAVNSDAKELMLTGRRGGRGQSADLGAEVAEVYDRIYGTPDAASRMAGVWIYNEVKTVLRDGTPTIFEVADPGGGFRFRRGATRFTAAFDGKEHPLGASARARTVVLKRISERAFEMDYKDSDGKVIQQRRVNVSEDGNLMRITDVFHPAGGGHHLTIFSRKQ